MALLVGAAYLIQGGVLAVVMAFVFAAALIFGSIPITPRKKR
jgi:hypothetical protein